MNYLDKCFKIHESWTGEMTQWVRVLAMPAWGLKFKFPWKRPGVALCTYNSNISGRQGDPGSFRLPLQWESLLQGNKAESDRGRYQMSSGLYMCVHRYTHSHIMCMYHIYNTPPTPIKIQCSLCVQMLYCKSWLSCHFFIETIFLPELRNFQRRLNC